MAKWNFELTPKEQEHVSKERKLVEEKLASKFKELVGFDLKIESADTMVNHNTGSRRIKLILNTNLPFDLDRTILEKVRECAYAILENEKLKTIKSIAIL